MDIYNGFGFEKIVKDDINALTQIMKRAFDEDSRRHLGMEEGGPPGYDNGDFIRKWYFQNNSHAYKVSKGDEIIGAINVFICDDNVNYLGNMFVNPLCQDKGIGTVIWKYIEQKYPETKIWRTETPGFSKRNHNFYINKCGFKLIEIKNPKDKYEESYTLEKKM
ncbi:MAG: GNAT family N-acetyltransferase [Oscillospiraceae bacterium]|nr:GNAT family N-acetyltransferase [Oscillospiraceae bacterium]